MGLIGILESPHLYRLWQLPFWRAKFAPVARHNDLTRIERVLDVGCGPGTNAKLFAHTQYLGLDWNGKYISYARRRYAGQFVQADVRCFEPPPGTVYDFVLVNSFFHHLDDEATAPILARLERTLTPGGHIQILDLVLPSGRSIARYLAAHDRGKLPRALEHWRELFLGAFDPVVLEPYCVSLSGVPLWHMVYFKGARKTDGRALQTDDRGSRLQ